MNLADYLQRIQYAGSREPNASTLRALHVAHLYTVPFENLDIHLQRPIVLDRAALFEKIVTRKRGGFCYEVNGMFSWLLQELGFDVTLLSARVANQDGSFGAEYDHLTLLVKCPADANPTTPWLADVGFGDSFVEPLRLDLDTEQPQGLRAYRISQGIAHDAARDTECAMPCDKDAGEYQLLWQKNYDGSWEKQYRFTLKPRAFSEFEAMCKYHQISPESPFTRKRIITRATPRGRVSLDDTRLILTKDGEREELEAKMDDALLLEHFDVEL